jgi:hypothetical protein
MFKANPQALAEAVAQAKLLGTTLEQTKKQASSLLNFETSIENELQAELLTGQQLNLERARAAALIGDQTTVMSELASQNIDFNKFSNMNVIAQNKVADALGLSSDELSNQLLKQQYMNMSREQVVALAGEEVAKRVEAVNAQDRFNAAMEHLQDIVGGLVGGPLGKMADLMAKLADSAVFLYSTLIGITAISFGKTLMSLAVMASELGLAAAGGIATASAITLGIGAAAIAAGIVAATAAYMSSRNETTQPMAKGGLLYGPTNILAGEYQGAENNPEVIAPLSDLQSIIDRNRIVVNNEGSQETASMISILNETMKGVKEGINQLNSKEGKVYMGSQQVGTAQLMNNYNLA